MVKQKVWKIFQGSMRHLSLEPLPELSDLPPTTNKTFVFKKAYPSTNALWRRRYRSLPSVTPPALQK